MLDQGLLISTAETVEFDLVPHVKHSRSRKRLIVEYRKGREY